MDRRVRLLKGFWCDVQVSAAVVLAVEGKALGGPCAEDELEKLLKPGPALLERDVKAFVNIGESAAPYSELDPALAIWSRVATSSAMRTGCPNGKRRTASPMRIRWVRAAMALAMVTGEASTRP